MIWRSWVGRSSDEHGRVTWCLSTIDEGCYRLEQPVPNSHTCHKSIVFAPSIHSSIHWQHLSAAPSQNPLLNWGGSYREIWQAALTCWSFAFWGWSRILERLYEYWNWRRFDLENVLKNQHFPSSIVFMYITDSMWSALRAPCPSMFTVHVFCQVGYWCAQRARSFERLQGQLIADGMMQPALGTFLSSARFTSAKISPEATTGAIQFRGIASFPRQKQRH